MRTEAEIRGDGRCAFSCTAGGSPDATESATARPGEPRLLWVGQNDGPPHGYLVAACRQAGELVRELHWASYRGRAAAAWPGRRVRRPAGTGAPDERQAGQPADAPRVRPRPRGRPGHLRARAGRAVRGPVQAVPAAQGDLPGRGRLPPHRPNRQCLPQGRRPPARRALRRRLRGQQPIRPGVPDPNAPRSGGQDHRRLVAGRHAGRPRGASPGRGAGRRGGAAVRLRRPAHPPEGHRPGDPRVGGLPTAVRPVRPVGHRRRPRTGVPGPAQPSAGRRGGGHLPRDGGPPGPQGRLPGLPGVRVPDPPGPHRPRRGGGPERGRAGGGVADDGSGRHDRARRRERDRRGPEGRVGAGRGDAPSRRSGDVARSSRGRPADQRGPAARRRPARWC